jgi:dTDP-4-dehydrorhamnose reductase
MRMFVTGCGGMLGAALYPALRTVGHEVLATDRNVNESWLSLLDVRDYDAVRRHVDAFRPDVVYHLAAETDLEWCERHPEEAADTNARATDWLARLCAARHIPLVYISTAGVFDGEKGTPYDERDRPAPINVYGRTKFAGEGAIREAHGRYYIVRAGWMIGGGPKDHKFVAKIAGQLKDGCSQIYAVDDKFGTPTYTKDFAANLEILVQSGAYGTYHMVCEGGGTRYDVAREIITVLGCTDVAVVPVKSDFFAEDYFAPRPRSEMMVNRALRQAGLNRMRPWREAVADYIRSGNLLTRPGVAVRVL